MTESLSLAETMHPNSTAHQQIEALVGIDSHKALLLEQLELLLDRRRVDDWLARFHPRGLPLADHLLQGAPLVILAGEVGCGKTALATSIATPLANRLDRRVMTLETPSNLRGAGHVGELSLRVTFAFEQARRRVTERGAGLLIIDEADDIAASREQSQAHHEDRAGLNVLVKQVDQTARSGLPMAVLLITNRLDALDPAIQRRAALTLQFDRPDANQRAALFRHLLRGVAHRAEDIALLVDRSEHPMGYAWSDLTQRVGRRAVLRALGDHRSLQVVDLLQALSDTPPTPRLGGAR